jgi:hypothetical protein
MEILRFEEATTTAPKRKKSSKGYLTAGFVATLFGLGSAFASNTIAINGNAPIALGQGVTIVTACDDAISVVPITEMVVEEIDGPTFYMTELQISGINSTSKNPDTGVGCGGTTFDVQIYDGSDTPTPYSCEDLNIGEDPALAPNDLLVLNCVGADLNKLSFDVLAKTGESNYIITFDKAPSNISYVTLVTRQTPIA